MTLERRTVFFLVFCITLASTVIAALVSYASGQTLLRTVLFSLATMWIMGIISQIALQGLYQSVVRPLEQARAESNVEDNMESLIEDVERIDEVTGADGMKPKRRSDVQTENAQALASVDTES